MTFVPRKCTEISECDSRDGARSSSQPAENVSQLLEDYRAADAFVLLGAPGAGKTTALRMEAECTGGCYVTARDFMTFDDKPEWKDTALYIDGLDEARAGAADGRTPLDKIRAKLDQLGRPRFRLSCREADWFGANDRNHLKTVSPDSKITVLHLDPLSDTDIREILRGCEIQDVDAFIASADEKGIDALLVNPQSLLMLANAVAGEGDWPETRMQVFDMACRTLLREPNPEHRIAQAEYVDSPDLTDAAEQLCAVQLLTGVAGYSLPGHESSHDFPAADMMSGKAGRMRRLALSTKLFVAPVEGRVTPVHRQIAEFLAARYLARLIDEDLPVGRVLALMTGYDGAVVSELRGLSAWLAVHSKPGRVEVIARDPLGTILYGDVREFSPEEKRLVLDGLNGEAQRNPWFVRAIPMDSRLGDLVSTDMNAISQEILTDPARDAARQAFILILVESLRYGQPLPELSERMMKVVRDDSWWPRIRYRALEAFVRHQQDPDKRFAELELLATDINAGRVSDPNDDLLGDLLTALYPAGLSVRGVLQYLRPPRDPAYFGTYYLFWSSRVPANSTSTQLAELLDRIAGQCEEWQPTFAEPPGRINALQHVPFFWLRRVLETSPDPIPPDRLFDWFAIVSKLELRTSPYNLEFFRDWLSANPGVLKELVKLGVRYCVGSENFRSCMYRVEERLFRAVWPPDFGSWCLEQAIATEDHDAKAWFMYEVVYSVRHRRQDENLSTEVVDKRLVGNAALQNIWRDALRKTDERRESLPKEDETQERQSRRQSMEHVKAHEAALAENRAPPVLLHQLAGVYYGHFIGIEGGSAMERLTGLLGDDENLIQAVLAGFRGSIRRSDAPTAAQIIRLGTQNRTHHLALPIMAGLEADVRTAGASEISFGEMEMRLALAIRYTVPILPQDAGDRPANWFSIVLASHPEIVSEVLVQSIRSKMRSGQDFRADVHDLAHSPDHAAVAAMASLPLLEKLPVRCTERELPSLSILLHSALLHCNKKSLLELIDKKLVHRSMNVAQRVYWLAAGFLVAPASYREKLGSYVAGNERRIRRLAEAIANKNDIAHSAIARVDVSALQLLIRLIGSSCVPYSLVSDSTTNGMATSAMEASYRIREFIDRMASSPSRDATKALEMLLADGDLRPWRSLLVDAAGRQRAARREAGFRHCNVGHVVQVLNNREPANAADLAALTIEVLAKISSNISQGRTSDWRQYWNVDSHNQPQNPKPENGCRDALASDLTLKMSPFGVAVKPESHYADDKRSDISVCCADFNVPIEVKRSCHRKLWSAIETQLIAKYTRDPDTNGYGIYLIFWFGDTERCRPTPGTGPPPKSAAELEERLRGTLSDDDKLKISICSVDVSCSRGSLSR